jgi:hypothetical protein
MYYLRECQNTSQGRKDEFYAELAERRKNNGEQRSTRRDTGAVQSFLQMLLLRADRPIKVEALSLCGPWVPLRLVV